MVKAVCVVAGDVKGNVHFEQVSWFFFSVSVQSVIADWFVEHSGKRAQLTATNTNKSCSIDVERKHFFQFDNVIELKSTNDVTNEIQLGDLR